MTIGSTLLFVEDPGSANYVINLSDALQQLGIDGQIFATGKALPYLLDRGQNVTALEQSADSSTMLMELAPDAVIVGTSENSESFAFELIAAAHNSYIISAGIVDATVNPALRFKGRSSYPLHHVPDHVLVPDTQTCQAFVDLGLGNDRVHIVGNPKIDDAAATARNLAIQTFSDGRLELFGAESIDIPVIVFTSELSDGLDPTEFRHSDEYTLHGRGRSTERTHVVLEEVLDALASLSPKPNLVLRLHPKEKEQNFEAYYEEIWRFSSGGDPLPTLYFADAIVGLTSTILLEAAAMGLPVVSVVPRETERNWLTAPDVTIFSQVSRQQDVAPAIKNALDQERHSLAKSGSSLQKVANVITQLVMLQKAQSTNGAKSKL